MERELQMIYVDQRGSGASERPASGDYALTTLVEDIDARFVECEHSGHLVYLDEPDRFAKEVAAFIHAR